MVSLQVDGEMIEVTHNLWKIGCAEQRHRLLIRLRSIGQEGNR
jgi:hypothetical protein